MAEPVISIRDLTKWFPVRRGWKEALRHPIRSQYTTALHRIDCDIRRGELFGLLGPNGAGKTTLFKVLATLILPDDGTASVAGFDIKQAPAAVRGILGPVFGDERSLYWRLSARENLCLFATLQGMPRGAVPRRVSEVLSLVGLGEAGGKTVGAFSSGMKQRLLIARALIATPQVLLLDEPTRSLDPITARDFRAFLREEIAGRRGCTVVLATHNTEEALQLCDRVAILNRGRLLAIGAPATLKQEFGDGRYRLWTRNGGPTTFAALASHGLIPHHLFHETERDGWSIVELEVPGGPPRVARVLEFLIGRGVAVARCEPIDPSLADLIERVLQRA